MIFQDCKVLLYLIVTAFYFYFLTGRYKLVVKNYFNKFFNEIF